MLVSLMYISCVHRDNSLESVAQLRSGYGASPTVTFRTPESHSGTLGLGRRPPKKGCLGDD